MEVHVVWIDASKITYEDVIYTIIYNTIASLTEYEQLNN